MSRLVTEPVKTFSIGFEGAAAYDETAAARRVAERFGTDHTEFRVRPSAVQLVDRLIWHHDGPFGDSSAIPTYLVSELTRQHVTVVLTGDGGDEVFAGYLRFVAALAASVVPVVPRCCVGTLARRPPRTNAICRARGPRASWMPLLDRLSAGTPFQDDPAGLQPDVLREAHRLGASPAAPANSRRSRSAGAARELRRMCLPICW
jgi:asparagine synthetase B (glutamine-hydrolysing)